MIATCPVCGKLTAIYWPEFWVYRRGETFYCSENCKVVGQTQDIKLINQVARDRRIRKGVEKMGHHKLTLEQKKKAVEIARQGGDQLEYLKKCGAKNPSAAWWYIKEKLVDKDMEKTEEPAEVAKKLPEEQAEKPILAETAEEVPPVTVEQKKQDAIMSAKDGIPILPDGKSDFTARTVIDETGLRVEVVKRPEKLEVMALKSAAVPGTCYTKEVELVEGGYDELMSLGYPATMFKTGVNLKMNRQGWEYFAEEIRQALKQMGL